MTEAITDKEMLDILRARDWARSAVASAGDQNLAPFYAGLAVMAEGFHLALPQVPIEAARTIITTIVGGFISGMQAEAEKASQAVADASTHVDTPDTPANDSAHHEPTSAGNVVTFAGPNNGAA
jgi:hypothetical protein